jgi:hypothetical protein
MPVVETSRRDAAGTASKRGLKRAQWLLLVVLTSTLLHAQVNMITYHNDNWRTGQNTEETVLTPSNVGPNHFGKLCAAPVDGQIYAQPLVGSNVPIKGHTYPTVVYVATQNDSVYAIDGTNCNVILGPVSLLGPGESPVSCKYVGTGACATIAPVIGILGTPVGDAATLTLYLDAYSQLGTPPTQFFHRLHALNPLTLSVTQEKWGAPVVIAPPGEDPSQFAHDHIQRPGLLALGNRIYLAYSMMDGSPFPYPPGYVLSYSKQNLTLAPLSFETTPGGNGGGIWQGGGGLAAGVDSTGQNAIYFGTADGTFDQAPNGQCTDCGESFVKLTTGLQLADFFSPFDELALACQCNDQDFGSGGVTLIPDHTLASHPFLAVIGDKEGKVYVSDRNSLGGFHGSCTGSCPAQVKDGCSGPLPVCTGVDQNLQTVQVSTHTIHNNGAFWNGNLYYASGSDVLGRYPISDTCDPGPVCPIAAKSNRNGQDITFFYGATPAISSNDTSNGLVWIVNNSGNLFGGNPAILYAFDAITLNQIYTSNFCEDSQGMPLDHAGKATKFSVPTVANGHVYLGTQTELDIYGPLSRTCH